MAEPLSDLEQAILQMVATEGDASALEEVVEAAAKRLAVLGLLKADSEAFGFGYLVTDAGKAFLAWPPVS